MNVFITGATGLIGSVFSRRLIEEGHCVTVLTRDALRARKRLGESVRCISSLSGMDNMDDFDAVVNLCGENIGDKRWTVAQKRLIEDSRWLPTEKIAALIINSKKPPEVFISGSAIGWYGSQADAILTEESKSAGGFLHDVCAKWENLALAAESGRTRVCIIRTGVVLAPSGGMLGKLEPFFKLGLGAVLGDGKQYMSWISLNDIVGILLLLLEKPAASGIFNACAPNPVRADVFSHSFASSLGRKCRFRIPEWLLKIVLGERVQVMLASSRAIPNRLEKMSFKFSHPKLETALKQIAGNV